MKILAFDISSSTIGWSSFEIKKDKITLLNYGHIKPITKKKAGGNIYKRLEDTISKVKVLFEQEKPDDIVIEDYAKKFSSGRSSANTIIILAIFNETIGLESFRFTGKEPVRYSVANIRSSINKRFGTKVKDKDDVINFVDENFSNFKITLNRVNNTKKECEDEADSIILGYHHLLTEKARNTK